MLIDFFYTLRAAKLPVSVKEYLTLLEALKLGVVGPNGCGKSNVVDAIKWVIGEQSAKALRGGEMADVIFNGCASRRGMAFAEVTLVLDQLPAAMSSLASRYRRSAVAVGHPRRLGPA